MSKNASITIYYDSGEVDLKAMMEELSKFEGGRYSKRRLSEIGRMVLEEYLPKELEKEKQRQTNFD